MNTQWVARGLHWVLTDHRRRTGYVPRVGPSTSGNRHSGWVSRTSTTQRPRLPSESPRPTQHRYNVGQRGVAADVVVLHSLRLSGLCRLSIPSVPTYYDGLPSLKYMGLLTWPGPA